ncbi:S9 family peptidase [Asticcacaulis endophyticus]|uniref:Peptidase S9 n=1 Tax=Asticcacaulis endophyticus TaxID=1395890 RepID=A0A918QAG6_9CAUL|nr:S9 family peptidase [Asticcacaulis endophyticus]GGZ37606.1 peptidase S9 [Asticcacaulis endophyticus]
MSVFRFGVSAWILCLAVSAHAEILTPERVFSDPALSGPKAVGAKLSPDGEILTWLKPKASNAQVQDLWAVPVRAGTPYVIVDADQLSSASKVLSEAEKARRERMRVSARGVVAYDWDGSSKSILVPLDGDIYRVDRASRKITQVTDTPDDEVDAKLSPSGKHLSYVRANTLYVKDMASGAETAMTPKGDGTLSYGVAEFIAQEELGRYTGYWWSPDSARIAYAKVDESQVDIVPRIEIGGSAFKLIEQRYPKAGTKNAVVELYVKTLNGEAIKVDLGDDSDIYLARVNWAADGKTLYVQRLSRTQQQLDLLKVDPATGAASVFLSETSDSWIDLNNDFKPLKDGRFLWSSEADGNNHIYLYGADGKLIHQVTKGDWPVDHIASVNEAMGDVWFEASKDTPIESRLYKVNYKIPTAPVAVTSAGGWWVTSVSDGGKVFIGTYSDPKTPSQTGLYDARGKLIRWIEENALDQNHPYFAFKDEYSAPEFGTLKASDGQDLHWSMLKPKGFDPSRRYPVIVSIYGGPAKAMVQKTWVNPADRLFQEAGYIVFSLDNRGTPNRSVAFERAIYKQFGGPDIDDQIMGANWLKTLPYVDGEHIGMMGWSQGGFVTLMALTAKDTPFAAGAAGAPPTEWGLYDTAYTERYMSTPQANAENYAKYDVVNRLDNLKPNSLLLMHGMADDNVILANTTRVIEALQQKSIPFELMLYPGERHGVRGNAKNLFRYKLYLDFFDRKLKP